MTIPLTRALALLQGGDASAAEQALSHALADHPADAALRLVRGVARRAQGQPAAALEDFWGALAAAPDHAGAQAAAVETVLAEGAGAAPQRDYALHNGERQTATSVEAIRADHRARYAMAALWLRRHRAPSWRLTGLDAFCGNGYGCRLLADAAGARMVGLDASAEAVALARRCFGDHRVVFGNAVFPFALAPGLFDFATCFESAEHVDDPTALLGALSDATQGPLFVSVPLEEGLPFARNRDLFRHHTRHFRRDEILALLAELGRPVIAAQWGQQVYAVRDGRVEGLLPPAHMHLRQPDADSQFLMLVALRP